MRLHLLASTDHHSPANTGGRAAAGHVYNRYAIGDRGHVSNEKNVGHPWHWHTQGGISNDVGD